MRKSENSTQKSTNLDSKLPTLTVEQQALHEQKRNFEKYPEN